MRWGLASVPLGALTTQMCVPMCWAGLTRFEDAGLVELMVPSDAEASLHCGQGG